jgi:DNA-binding transcriptional LysR family regulator
MDTRNLRRALTLARLLNFTRAACDLNITQSALSRSIQALETECRLQLFDRTRGVVTLTAAGHEFMQHAQALLRHEAMLRSAVDLAAQGQGGRITLGVTPLVARILLPSVLCRRVDQPNFHAQVCIRSSKEILPMVRNESVELGICVGDLALAKQAFDVSTLAQFSLAVIVRNDHPLTRIRRFCAEDLRRYPLVRSTPFGCDDVLPLVVELERIELPAVTIEDYEVLNQVVSGSDAIWITSPLAARHGISSGKLASLPMPWLPEAKMSLVAYSLGKLALSPIARTILGDFRLAGAELSAM